MNTLQITIIEELRSKGLGPKAISDKLSISINTVKSQFKRAPASGSANTCRCCGEPLVHLPHHREKHFCSAACRTRWWNDHRSERNTDQVITITCKSCGKEFRAYESAHRRYCSVSCYRESRRNG